MRDELDDDPAELTRAERTDAIETFVLDRYTVIVIDLESRRVYKTKAATVKKGTTLKSRPG